MPVALLMKPSGATLARLERDDLPATIEHEGQTWCWSHRTATGAAYQVQRIAPRLSPQPAVARPRWSRSNASALP